MMRAEDKKRYSMADEKFFADSSNPMLTLVQREFARKMHLRSLRALEVSKLDPIAAFNVFSGIHL